MQPPLPPMPRQSAQMGPAEAFAGTWQRSGVALRPESKAEIWRVLEEAYGARQRHYHNLDHIVDSLAFVGMCLQSGRKLEDQAAVEWALWFHDAVYDPKAADNEERSARVAERLLSAAGLPPASVARVRACILATATHLHSADRDEHVVVDADMAVLGAPLPRYALYAAGVRREHAHLTDAEFLEGRTKFLRSLLEREQLFATDVGKSLEQQARANIAHELQLTSVGLFLESNIEDLPAVAEAPEEEQEMQEAEVAARKVAARA
ncbi:MAG: hypothetical protein J3K34DRAFT_524073 [Monoraphidium minutum]|nr:MAG: hypothetical protein J3K34DRAFT_524073 [Monoraphidium minutum]